MGPISVTKDGGTVGTTSDMHKLAIKIHADGGTFVDRAIAGMT